MDFPMLVNESEVSYLPLDLIFMIIASSLGISQDENDPVFSLHFSHKIVSHGDENTPIHPISSYSMNPPIILMQIHERVLKKHSENIQERYFSSLMIATSSISSLRNSGLSKMESSSYHMETMRTIGISENDESISICRSSMLMANLIWF